MLSILFHPLLLLYLSSSTTTLSDNPRSAEGRAIGRPESIVRMPNDCHLNPQRSNHRLARRRPVFSRLSGASRTATSFVARPPPLLGLTFKDIPPAVIPLASSVEGRICILTAPAGPRLTMKEQSRARIHQPVLARLHVGDRVSR